MSDYTIIDLGGGADFFEPLYPAAPGTAKTSLAERMNHWLKLTLDCDGLGALGSEVHVTANDAQWRIDGYTNAQLAEIRRYGPVLSRYHEIGAKTLNTVIPALKSAGRWDPQNTGKWHFFMPHGLGLLNYKTVQFFHYPPLRLLELGSYLDDPVPYRWGQLLETAGVAKGDVNKYQRFLDGAPIAAPDDQGAYMPIDAFVDYQHEMLELFLTTPGAIGGTHTVPVCVFGIPAMAQFEKIWHANLDILVPMPAKVLKGLKTGCLGATHPYHFYAQAQLDFGQGGSIGDGHMGRGCQLAEMFMRQDLIAAHWQRTLGEDPTADVNEAQYAATAWAMDPAMDGKACQLTYHQGSLYYANPNALTFDFKTSMDEARTFCSANRNNACSGISSGS